MILYISARIRRLRLLDYALLPVRGFSAGFALYSFMTRYWGGVVLGVVALLLCGRIHEALKAIIKRLENETHE